VSAGLYLGLVGMVICAVAAAGSAWGAVREIRGCPGGAALIAACLALAVVGVAAVVSGMLVAMGEVR
jgi:hypothetical protein